MPTAPHPSRTLSWIAIVLAGAVALLAHPALAQRATLLQGAYVDGTEIYRFSHRSIPALPVANAPEDADWSRWAMMHDGTTYRLLVARLGEPTLLYQFGLNFETERYEQGFRVPAEVRVAGRPPEASLRNFAVLHDGQLARLYLQDRNDYTKLHQFALNEASGAFEYGHRSTPQLRIVDFPPDADWRRWAMLHDGTDYRVYVFRRGSDHQLYQGAWEERTGEYSFGHRSIQVVTLMDFPRYSDRNSVSMLHDGVDYRLFLRAR